MLQKRKSVICGFMSVAAVLIACLCRAQGVATAAEIAHMSWTEANISALRLLDQDSIQKFVNSPEAHKTYEYPALNVILPVNVLQFEWADFAGNGKYALVVVWNTGRIGEAISIYRQNAIGKIDKQRIELEGYGYEGPLKDAIGDFNGDGKKELLVNSGFGGGRSMADTPSAQWPMVYRLEDGKMVEASREFPSFYDKQVLPPIETEISALQKKLGSEGSALASGEAEMKEYHWIVPDVENHSSLEQAQAVKDSERLALLQSLRDHILFALGRTLTREQLAEVRGWVKSPDPWLVRYAETTFVEMDGHDAEVSEAEQAVSRINEDFYKAMKERPAAAP